MYLLKAWRKLIQTHAMQTLNLKYKQDIHFIQTFAQALAGKEAFGNGNGVDVFAR